MSIKCAECGFKAASDCSWPITTFACHCADCKKDGDPYLKLFDTPEHTAHCRQQKEKKAAEEAAKKEKKREPSAKCFGCGYTVGEPPYDHSMSHCMCIDCVAPNTLIVKDLLRNSQAHADYCMLQKEKKVAEEKEKENTLPAAAETRKCGCGDEFGHPRRPVEKPPAAVTHDASGYPLPGKCPCGYELSKFDIPPKGGSCQCCVCREDRGSDHFRHCLRKLKDRLAEQQKTVDAQSDIITLKDDRIAILEAALTDRNKVMMSLAESCDKHAAACHKKDSRIAELEAETRVLGYTVEIERAHMRLAKDHISELEAEVADKQRRISELIGPHNSAVEKLDAKDRRIAELEKQLAEKTTDTTFTPTCQASFIYLERERPEAPLAVDRTEPAGACEFVQSTSRNIELRFGRYVGHVVICYPGEAPKRPLIRESTGRIDPELIKDPVAAIKELYKLNDKAHGELAEARITIAGKDKQINEQAHRLHEKQVQIDTMRAQIEQLKRDSAEMKGVLDGAEHDEAVAQEKLKKAKAQIGELESIIAAYARDDSCKTGVINEMREQMAHFKRYRKYIINIVSSRINKSCVTLAEAERYLSLFPELRSAILKCVIFARKFQSIATAYDMTDAQRISSISFARQLEELNGAEHSPASGSTPESG